MTQHATKAPPVAVESENGTGWLFDLNGIKGKEAGAFQAAAEKLLSEGGFANLEGFYPWLTKVVKAWPFEFSPTDADSYGELGLLELREVLERFTAYFQQVWGASVQTADGSATGSEGHPAGQSAGVESSAV